MANGSVLIVLLVLCSSALCISSVASAGGVLVTRPMEGDTCIGNDENAESIVNEGECAFVSCASGYELNSDGVCAIPIPTRGTKEGFVAPGTVTVPGTLEDDLTFTLPGSQNCEGSWTEWGGCNAFCGGGQETRVWTTTTLPMGSGTLCPTPTLQSRVCNTEPCSDGSSGGVSTNIPTLLDGQISWQGGGHSERGGLIWLNDGSAPWNKMYKFRCEKNGEVSDFTQEFGPVSHYNWINPKVRVARDGQRPCTDNAKLQIFEGDTNITSQMKNFDEVTAYNGTDRGFTDTR